MLVKKGRGCIRGFSGKRYTEGMEVPRNDVSEATVNANLKKGRLVKGKEAERLHAMHQPPAKSPGRPPKEKKEDK